jgi:hypothetical protein
MSSTRLVRILSAAIVAAIAAWSSYWHMVHVALRYGERSEVAYVLPLSVDGVLTVSAIVMAEDRRAHRPVRLIAKAAFLAHQLSACCGLRSTGISSQPHRRFRRNITAKLPRNQMSTSGGTCPTTRMIRSPSAASGKPSSRAPAEVR